MCGEKRDLRKSGGGGTNTQQTYGYGPDRCGRPSVASRPSFEGWGGGQTPSSAWQPAPKCTGVLDLNRLVPISLWDAHRALKGM